MTSRKWQLGALSLVTLLACGSSDRKVDPASPPDAKPAAALGTPVPGWVAHEDPRLGVPSFVWITRRDFPKLESAAEAARFAIHGLARDTYRLTPGALAAISEPEIHDVGAGAIIARFKQRVGGIEIFRGGVSIALSRAFEPVSSSGSLAPTLVGSEKPFVLDHARALDKTHSAITSRTGRHVGSLTHKDTAGGYERFTAPGLSEPARTKKVFFPVRGGLVPAYYTEMLLATGEAWAFVVSATDGAVLFETNLVRHDAPHTYRAFANPTTLMPTDGPQGNGYLPHPTGEPDGIKIKTSIAPLITLGNFPFSKNDPWLASDATTTFGNNVSAYADLNGTDGYQSGGDARPTIAGSTFDFVYDVGAGPGATATNLDASVTQLFYLTNFLHDWYYDVGFDEVSGNHQANNFGRGGIGLDELKVEAQDYSGKNNANATTPPDGTPPRIQMYVFSGPSEASLTVASPASIAGVKPAGIAGFGKDSFDFSGGVVLADDGQGVDGNDACEPITNNVTGKIVLVHRGLCSFIQKTQMVQQAGGAGAIIANVPTSAQPDQPPSLGGGGEGSPIAIPVLGLALADGKAIEAALGGGVTVNMKRTLEIDLDGGLDTSVLSHEWGHVLSGRLIGDGIGLTLNQALGLGEGWADFSAMMVLVHEDDVTKPHGAGWAGTYEEGGYAMSGQADLYFGIRRVPYSTDLTKDPLTFKHIQNGVPLPDTAPISFGEDGGFNAEVHSTGEIWATMLWECYAALLNKYPYADAQLRMKRYFVASLKLTPDEPTLLEARDAVLAAALAADPVDYELFWTAFAKRGAGVGAKGPPKDSTSNVGVIESFKVGNQVEIVSATLKDDVITCDKDGILDSGEVGTIEIKLKNSGVGALADSVAFLSAQTAGMELRDLDVVKLGALAPFDTKSIQVKAQIRNAPPIDALALDVVVSDPTFVDAKPIHLTIPTRFDSDEASDSSAVDHVETKSTSWKASTLDTSGTTIPWDRTSDDKGRYWTVPDSTEAAEQILLSPPFTIEDTTFSLAWKHRWSFRISTRRKVDIDGGIVEVSVDNGKTWKDISTYGKIDYNTTLDTGGRADNPLIGVKAFGNKSEGYPDTWHTTHVDVTLPAHPDKVRVRFHTGSGSGFSGAPGWDLDDIELGGISSTPFWAFVAQQDLCDPNAPVVDAGPPHTVQGLSDVVLTGTGSSPAGDFQLNFHWTQETGPLAGIIGADTPVLTISAPDVAAPTVLRFALRADDGALLSPASRVDVTVTPYTSDPAASAGCACRTERRAPRSEGAAAIAGVAIALWLARRLTRRIARKDAA